MSLSWKTGIREKAIGYKVIRYRVYGKGEQGGSKKGIFNTRQIIPLALLPRQGNLFAVTANIPAFTYPAGML